MKTLIFSLFVSAMTIFSASEAEAQDVSFPPIGYAVEVSVDHYKHGHIWYELEVFETEAEAEEYEDFLWFVSDRDMEKLLKEMNLPEGHYTTMFFRVRPVYNYELMRLYLGESLPLLGR